MAAAAGAEPAPRPAARPDPVPTACGKTHAAFGRRSIPAEPRRFRAAHRCASVEIHRVFLPHAPCQPGASPASALTRVSPPAAKRGGTLAICYRGHQASGALSACGPSDSWNPRQASPVAGWDTVQVAVDDHTRLAYVEVLGDQTGTTGAAFLDRAVAWRAARQINIHRVMSDNGSGTVSPRARAACQAHALRHLRTRPFSSRPQRSGRRSHGAEARCPQQIDNAPATSLDIGFSLDPCPGKWGTPQYNAVSCALCGGVIF